MASDVHLRRSQELLKVMNTDLKENFYSLGQMAQSERCVLCSGQPLLILSRPQFRGGSSGVSSSERKMWNSCDGCILSSST